MSVRYKAVDIAGEPQAYRDRHIHNQAVHNPKPQGGQPMKQRRPETQPQQRKELFVPCCLKGVCWKGEREKLECAVSGNERP